MTCHAKIKKCGSYFDSALNRKKKYIVSGKWLTIAPLSTVVLQGSWELHWEQNWFHGIKIQLLGESGEGESQLKKIKVAINRFKLVVSLIGTQM